MTFRFKLYDIDSYRAQPTFLDPRPRFHPTNGHQNSAILGQGSRRVPIIRIFGSTESGTRVCAHVHGAFPYLYIDYPDEYAGRPDILTDAHTGEVIRKLQANINLAMNNLLNRRWKRDPCDENLEEFVAGIFLVKGVPFYGYNYGWKLYCKIYMNHPRHMSKLSELLSSGKVMGRAFFPHEAHIQHKLQFMIDLNLFGCGYIECKKVRYRVEGQQDCGPDFGPRANTLPESDFPRQTWKGIEVDIHVRDITNRSWVRERKLHDCLTETCPPISQPLVHSLSELWKAHSQAAGMGSKAGEITDMVSSKEEDVQPEWDSEYLHREAIDRLLEKEQSHEYGGTTQLERFQTSYESVGALWGEEGTESGCLANWEDKWSAEPELPDEEYSGCSDDEFFEEGDDMLPDPTNDGFLDPAIDQNDSNAHGGVETDQESTIDNEESFNNAHEQKEGLNNAGRVERQPGASNIVKPDFLSSILPCHVQRAKPVLHEEDSSQNPKPTNEHFAATEVAATNIRANKATDSAARGYPADGLQIPSASDKPNLHTEAKLRRGINDTEVPALSTTIPPANQVQTDSPNQQTNTSQTNTGAAPEELQTGGKFGEVVLDGVGDYGLPDNTAIRITTFRPPSKSETLASQVEWQGAYPLYAQPYYGNSKDVPKANLEWGNLSMKVLPNTPDYLPEFDPFGSSITSLRSPGEVRKYPGGKSWQLIANPPKTAEFQAWVQKSKHYKRENFKQSLNSVSQIEGPTQKNKYGFQYSQRAAPKSLGHKTSDMTVMSLEIHANTRDRKLADPEIDSIACICWSIQSGAKFVTGLLAVAPEGIDGSEFAARFKRFSSVETEVKNTETDLITSLIELVRDYDPDILTGYEVHNQSWGYVIARGRAMDMDLCDELSRVKTASQGRFGKDNDRWGYSKASAIRITGRHILNIWRIMRGEIALTSYKLQNVAAHLLNRRIPDYSHDVLAQRYKSSDSLLFSQWVRYLLMIVRLNLELLEKQEFVSRISEQARLIGVDFYTVFSRGSQIKVESLMFRIAKPESYILPSPSKKQVALQNAIECKPLIMEPQSKYYTDPVVVLDFQSLYPSIMIAYNYCYSTCLGRVEPWPTGNKLGVLPNYVRPGGVLENVPKTGINFAPNGIIYLKAHHRKSLLAKMLSEILETRIMVKKRMKLDKGNKHLQQQLNSWQLALKLIANVTYGYTSASFSGRMPCSEIADSIVQTGRETLEQAIRMIHSKSRWRANVVYGDTDSLFIHLEGRTRDEAFIIGQEIADKVTAMNPRPVTLKFEKVYQGCFLVAMKRYVGFKYEHREQKEPEFDAKGIETVRRDGTPSLQKILEASLRMFFRDPDVSKVKAYCQRQWMKLMQDKVSVQDFIVAKEVKLGNYKNGAAPPAGARIAQQRMENDHRHEPQYGERVPFVVVAGQPGQRVYERIVEVEEILHSAELVLDADYYIQNSHIKALGRVFGLVGANVSQWYEEMHKYRGLRSLLKGPVDDDKLDYGKAEDTERGENTDGQDSSSEEENINNQNKSYVLEDVMDTHTSRCPLCSGRMNPRVLICADCSTRWSDSMHKLMRILAVSKKRVQDLYAVCRSCSGISPFEEVACNSQDCPVYYRRIRATSKIACQEMEALKILEYLEWAGEETGRAARYPLTRALTNEEEEKIYLQYFTKTEGERKCADQQGDERSLNGIHAQIVKEEDLVNDAHKRERAGECVKDVIHARIPIVHAEGGGGQALK